MRAVTQWDETLAAVGVALGGDTVRGRHDLRACWAGTTETDHAQRCVLAHDLAELEGDLNAEVEWDELEESLGVVGFEVQRRGCVK